MFFIKLLRLLLMFLLSSVRLDSDLLQVNFQGQDTGNGNNI